MMAAARCPCGSRLAYAECCEPLHRGRASGDVTAPSAERLMRSRYSAFALGEVDYLLRTWHPSTRPGSLDLDDAVEWLRLEIRSCSAGAEQDLTGTVEFIAHYWVGPQRERGQQHEVSAFVRERGDWYYVGPA